MSGLDVKEVFWERVVKLEKDVNWYRSRVEALEEILTTSIVVPDISDILETVETGEVEPYNHPELGRVVNQKMVYDLEVGDLKYMTLSLATWTAIIDVLRPIVEEIHGRPQFPVDDCDNWSASMSWIAQQAFMRAGADLQGALFIAWGYKHSYNGFIDTEDKVWIFDPMLDDYMVGELGQPLGRMYETKDIWFQG